MAVATLFQTTPQIAGEADVESVNLGTEFYATTTAWVTKIRYLQPSSGGTVTQREAAIYRVSDQVMVAGPFTLPAPDAGTWVTFTLPTALQVTANTRYRVAVRHPDGRYCATGSYYDPNGAFTTTTYGGFLVHVSKTDATGNIQGSYNYSTTLALPNAQFNGATYYSDVEATDVDPGGAGTTPVTATVASSWSSSGRVTATAPSAWAARARVGAQTPAGWGVHQRLTAGVASTWSVKARVSTTRSSAWDVVGAPAPVRSEVTSAWDVRTAVQATAVAAWQVHRRVSTSRASAWDARTRTGSQVASAWSVTTRLRAEATSAWTVLEYLERVQATTAASWALRTRLAAHLAAAWDIEAAPMITIEVSAGPAGRNLAPASVGGRGLLVDGPRR